MHLLPIFPDGYYWARNEISRDGSPFVVFRDGGLWYLHGVREPVEEFDPLLVICPVKPPVH